MRKTNPLARNALTAALPLAVAFAIGGCAVGPDYTRPDSTLPEQYNHTAASEANPLLETDWWTRFGDPVLDALVETALQQNTDMLAASARVARAQAAAREAGASLLPEIDARADTSRTRLSTATATARPGMVEEFSSNSIGLSTAYELDVWGRLRRGTEAARAQAVASHYARDAVRLSVAGLVANQYLALRAYDAMLAVSAASVAGQEKTLKLVTQRVDAGLASRLDRYRAERTLATFQAQAADLRLRRSLTQNQLALLVGQPDLKIARDDLRRLPMPPVPPAGLPSSLVQGRPDVRQAEAQLIAANATIGSAKAGYFPRFALTGSLGRESETLADLFTSGAGTGLLGLSALMPLLDFGRTEARVDQAAAFKQETVAAYQQTLQTAFREVNDALIGLRENAAGEQAQQRRVTAAKEAVQLAEHRYASGYSDYLDVLDAQLSHNESVLAYINTRQARLSAAVNLYKALGGGWKDGLASQLADGDENREKSL